MLGYGKDSRTYRVFNIVLHKIVETVDVRFDETNGSQREHLPSVIDEPTPEDSIKSRLLRMSFLPKNLLKNSFLIMMIIELAHLKKMLLKGMLIKFLKDNPLILALLTKCKLRRSLMTLKHQVLSHAQKSSHLSNFCGHFAFVSIVEPTKVDEALLEPEWI